MAKTYSVDKLIGKNLILNREVPVYRQRDDKKPIYRARAGQSAGTVYSWVTSAKTGDVFLMFMDKNKKPYFINTKDLSGSVDTRELKREGVLTTKEIEAEKQKETAPVEYYIRKYGLWLLGGLAAIVVIKKL